MRPQVDRDTIAIIGAGVIGCAVAWSLAREGRRVLLIDRDEPGQAGASFGNVGHIAAELVEPLPSPQLLFGFWPLLFAFGGPLQIPARRWAAFAPWALRFAAAAFRRETNTRALSPLVKPAAAAFETALTEIGRTDLLRRNGHYEVWLGRNGAKHARTEAQHMRHLGIATQDAHPDFLKSVADSAGVQSSAGLWFPQSAHVVDPLQICQAFARAAQQLGAMVWRADIDSIRPAGNDLELHTSDGPLKVSTAVVCAGVWSAPLLTPFGLHVPLEAAHGYHVELPGKVAHVDAPMVYVDRKILVTPMSGRIRASGYMEFSGLDAPPDPRKPARLRRGLQHLGYQCADDGPSWRGSRPVLPDYLPGLGRAPGPHRLFYAIAHQHIGLTLAPVTGALVADLVAERAARHDVAAFDLRRFGPQRRL